LYSYSKENASEEDVPVHNRTFYAYTKLLADAYVQLRLKNYLLIRTSFKPRPFPYEKAIMTQVGNFDYTDTVSNMIIKLIEKNKTGIYNVGTKRKTIYDLAVQTNPDVIASYEYLNENMPTNVTMDISKLQKALDE
jgi:dTDP-4-dehydrorhamnose reductase